MAGGRVEVIARHFLFWSDRGARTNAGISAGKSRGYGEQMRVHPHRLAGFDSPPLLHIGGVKMSQERIAALYAALGLRQNKMRNVWSAAPRGDRAMLALSAGLPRNVAGMEWDAMRPATQDALAAAHRRMVDHVKGWGVAA